MQEYRGGLKEEPPTATYKHWKKRELLIPDPSHKLQKLKYLHGNVTSESEKNAQNMFRVLFMIYRS